MLAIFASDMAGGFGFEGGLPWGRIPEDLKFFKEKTHNNYIAMGYNTWKTLPKLTNRYPIVITKKFIEGGVLQVCSKDHIKALLPIEEVLVIGGSTILTVELLRVCTEIFHTTIHGVHRADTYIDPEVLAYLSSLDHDIIQITDKCTIRRYF